jgi:hypothetical protein
MLVVRHVCVRERSGILCCSTDFSSELQQRYSGLPDPQGNAQKKLFVIFSIFEFFGKFATEEKHEYCQGYKEKL